MATARARASKKSAQNSSSLLNAVKFVSMSQKETGNVSQTHCRMQNGWIAASNGVLTLGAKIVDDLTACPQTTRLLQALARCGVEVSITQADASALSIKSGPLRVKVPCVEPDDVPIMWADPIVAPMDSRFTDALKTVQQLANENADKMHCASILCRNQTVMATTGVVIAETWHGIDTPPQWVLPKVASAILTSIDKKLIGFGFSGRSATFHFDDESWFKTQLYEDSWPSAERVFTPAQQLVPAPSKLFEALAIILPLVENNSVKFAEGAIVDGDELNYEVPDLKEGTYYKVRQLLSVAEIFKTYDSTSNNSATLFFGGNTRGAISKMNLDRAPVEAMKINTPTGDMDDDIPF
jgi:hypothetical protein